MYELNVHLNGNSLQKICTRTLTTTRVLYLDNYMN